MHRLSDELTQIKELLRNHPHGMTVTEIAAALGRNKHSTGRYLDILHAAGHVDLRTFGMAKVFTLSTRVPLSALLSYTTDLVLVLDSDLRIIQGNDTFFEFLGLPGEKILEKKINQIVTDDSDSSYFLSKLVEKVSEKTDQFEISINGINNKPPRYFQGKIIPTSFDDGSSADTIILEDITLEKEAIRSLKESEQFFRSVSDHLSDGLIVSELQAGKKKIIFHNQRLCEITGYSKDEIQFIRPEDLPLPEEKSRFKKAVSEAELDQGSMKEIRFWARKKDGSPIYISIRIKLVPFGDLTRGYILITDMTTWKKQEEARLLQATLIERLLTNFSHPIFIVGEDGKFFNANSAFCELINVKHETISGKHVKEVMPEKIATDFLKGNDDLILKKNSINVQMRISFYKPDGTLGDVLIEKSSVSSGENAPTYIFGVIIHENDFSCLDCISKKKVHDER